MKIARRARGFTLVEVLAAIVLTAIVLPVAMEGISLATSVADAARNRTEAAGLARSKLAELQVTRGWQAGNLSGDFGEDFPKYRWRADFAPWNSTTLQQLDVRVTWNAAGREMSVTVSTLVDTEAN